MMYNYGTSNNLVISCYASTYSSNVSGVTVYVFKSYAKEAEDFAKAFTDAMAIPCQNENNNNKTAVSAIWGTWKSKFESMTDSSVNSTINAKSVFATSTNATVEQARTLYLHIVDRYNLDTWTGGPVGANTHVNALNINGNNMSLIIVVISMASITAFGAFLFLRKRKEQ